MLYLILMITILWHKYNIMSGKEKAAFLVTVGNLIGAGIVLSCDWYLTLLLRATIQEVNEELI